MASYLIKNKINNPDQLKDFTGLGYAFDDTRSDNHMLVFTR